MKELSLAQWAKLIRLHVDSCEGLTDVQVICEAVNGMCRSIIEGDWSPDASTTGTPTTTKEITTKEITYDGEHKNTNRS